MGSGCGVTEVIGDGEGVAGVNAASGVKGDNPMTTSPMTRSLFFSCTRIQTANGLPQGSPFAFHADRGGL